MTGKGGQQKGIIFHFFGETTEASVNLDASLIELSRECSDHIPGSLLFPCYKNH